MLKLKKPTLFKIIISGIIFGLFVLIYSEFSVDQNLKKDEPIRLVLEERSMISKALSTSIIQNQYPTSIILPGPTSSPLFPTYTIDSDLQKEATKLLNQYKPDYGAIFMMNAQTGEVLAMASFQKDDSNAPNWNLKSNFPAASTFKVITATVAVDKRGLLPSHKIHYNGGLYTLYRKNVMSDRIHRWTNVISLKDAFARSVNSAFGRLSLEQMSPVELNDYATRFMFNQEIPTDFPVEMGIAYIPPEKSFELTEAASGFNKINKMTPVQGAMIAGAVVNDGRMVIPYLVQNLKDKDSNILFKAKSLDKGQIMSPESAEKLRELMEETVLSGTSRKTFQKLVRSKKFADLEMGGKTGHLNGENPKGRVDWFVGYGMRDDQKIALAAVTVSKKYWTVKSSFLGQSMISKYFGREEISALNLSKERD